MNINMSRAAFDALPDRTTLQFDPVAGHYYRDPGWPSDVFLCETVGPVRWACFRVEVADGGGANA